MTSLEQFSDKLMSWGLTGIKRIIEAISFHGRLEYSFLFVVEDVEFSRNSLMFVCLSSFLSNTPSERHFVKWGVDFIFNTTREIYSRVFGPPRWRAPSNPTPFYNNTQFFFKYKFIIMTYFMAKKLMKAPFRNDYVNLWNILCLMYNYSVVTLAIACNVSLFIQIWQWL